MSLLMTWYMNFILIWEDYGIFRYVSYIWLPNCTISPTEKNVVHARQLWNLKGVFLYIYCYKKIPSMHITLICFLSAIIKLTSNIRCIPQRMLKMNTFYGVDIWYFNIQVYLQLAISSRVKHFVHYGKVHYHR